MDESETDQTYLGPAALIEGKYTIKYLKQFVESNKKTSIYSQNEDPDNQIPLNEGQQEVLDYVDNFLNFSTVKAKQQPLRFILTGLAGGGKTLVIKRIRKRFEDSGRKVYVTSNYGSIATQINGVTCHSLFQVPYKGGSFEKLAPRIKKTKTLFQKFHGLDCLIIDEVYNLSPSFFHYISLVLSKSIGNPAPFAGVSVILAGDLLQLAPVASHSLWTDQSKLNSFQKAGSDIYRSFTVVFFLKLSMRSVDKEFSKLLLHIRQKRLTFGDLELLRSRRECVLSPEERSLFGNCQRIYPRNAFSKRYNINRLEQLDKPIVILKSVQEPAFPAIVDPEDWVPISVGARIRLTKNLDVPGGLATGAVAHVAGVLYDPECPTDILPSIILAKFDNIKAETLENCLIPIPSSKEYISDRISDKSFKVTSFPIQLAWGNSVHTSQGSSLDRVCIFLDYRELFVNSTYVSISRTRGGISSICFLDEEIPESRFESSHFYSGFTEIKREYERLGISKFLLSSADETEDQPASKRPRI